MVLWRLCGPSEGLWAAAKLTLMVIAHIHGEPPTCQALHEDLFVSFSPPSSPLGSNYHAPCQMKKRRLARLSPCLRPVCQRSGRAPLLCVPPCTNGA